MSGARDGIRVIDFGQYLAGTAIRRLQPFRYLHDCSDCFRLERITGWALHPLESAAFSRRTP